MHVAHRVIADMAHVDAPRGIGEHLQHVGLGLVAVAVGAEERRLAQRACQRRSAAFASKRPVMSRSLSRD